MDRLTEKFFAIFSAVIIISALYVFFHVFTTEVADLRITKNGVPLLISDAINPENGKSISVDDLVTHYKGM